MSILTIVWFVELSAQNKVTVTAIIWIINQMKERKSETS